MPLFPFSQPLYSNVSYSPRVSQHDLYFQPKSADDGTVEQMQTQNIASLRYQRDESGTPGSIFSLRHDEYRMKKRLIDRMNIDGGEMMKRFKGRTDKTQNLKDFLRNEYENAMKNESIREEKRELQMRQVLRQFQPEMYHIGQYQDVHAEYQYKKRFLHQKRVMEVFSEMKTEDGKSLFSDPFQLGIEPSTTPAPPDLYNLHLRRNDR